jgi:alkylhydroperoxidase family enzyme
MAHIPLSDFGATPFERLLGHAPILLDKWSHLEEALFQSKSFSADFLEQVRRALAYKNVCQYCMEKAGPPDQHNDESRLVEALNAANKFAIDHVAFGKDEINRLKQYFTDGEIIELIAFFAFISAVQRFNAVLGLQAAAMYPV